MTIIFGYFQYVNLFIFLYSIVPIIISTNFAIIISIFLFRVHKNRNEKVQNSLLLKVSGILIIIFSVLPFAMPAVQSSSMTEFELFILINYILLSGLLASVPFFISYGVFFYIFGKRNKGEYNVFLMIAGILWMISYGFNIVLFQGGLLSALTILYGYDYTIYSIFSIVNFIFTIIQLNGFILLIIHGVKNSDKNFLVVGILGLSLFIAQIIYYLILIVL